MKLINAGWSSPVARQAHNLKVVGSNPTPATNINRLVRGGFFVPAGLPLEAASLVNSVGLCE